MNRKLLVVEDQIEVVDSIIEGAYNGHMECSIDTTGEHCIKRAHEMHPDLIFLDMEIAGGKGFKLLKEIKDDEALNKIPIIFLSREENGHQVFDKIGRVGADGFVVNNENIGEFLNMVDEYLPENGGFQKLVH